MTTAIRRNSGEGPYHDHELQQQAVQTDAERVLLAVSLLQQREREGEGGGGEGDRAVASRPCTAAMTFDTDRNTPSSPTARWKRHMGPCSRLCTQI
jgi:hypothetical protein